DRGLRKPSLQADRVDRTESRRDTRQLCDQAPLRQADRDYPRPRRRAGDDARRPARHALPALPPGRGALHPRDAEGAGGRLRAASRVARPLDRTSRARTRACVARSCAGGSARPVLSALGLTSEAPAETEAVAGRLARELRTGDVVTVSGELGTGKTTFVRGACRTLGIEVPVTSPTFTIGHRYPGNPDVS